MRQRPLGVHVGFHSAHIFILPMDPVFLDTGAIISHMSHSTAFSRVHTESGTG